MNKDFRTHMTPSQLKQSIKNLESLIDGFIAKRRFSEAESAEDIDLQIAINNGMDQLELEKEILKTYGGLR